MDPAPEIPQSLGRYIYVLNRPLDLTDPSGLWPTRIHNQILQEAFNGELNPFDIRELQRISAAQDHLIPGQLPSNAHEHAMRGSAKQRVSEAETLYDNFLAENLSLSKVLLGNPHYEPNRWLYLGKSLHAIADNTSPAHEGFQVWELGGAIDHIKREWNITPTRLRAAVNEVKREYRRHRDASERFEKSIRISGVGVHGYGSFAASFVGLTFGGFAF